MTKERSSLKVAHLQDLSSLLMVKIPQTCKQIDSRNLEAAQNEESAKVYQEQYYSELQ